MIWLYELTGCQFLLFLLCLTLLVPCSLWELSIWNDSARPKKSMITCWRNWINKQERERSRFLLAAVAYIQNYIVIQNALEISLAKCTEVQFMSVVNYYEPKPLALQVKDFLFLWLNHTISEAYWNLFSSFSL